PGHVNRATIYLPPALGMTVLADIAAKGVDEFYVNPGAESDELLDKARALGLEPIVACSIVAIGEGPSPAAPATGRRSPGDRASPARAFGCRHARSARSKTFRIGRRHR